MPSIRSADSDLYARVWEFPNLLLAAHKAAKGKRGRSAAARFEATLPDGLIDLRDQLRTFTYRPEPYTSFTIHEPKRRLISAAAFRDRVVHHALCNVIEPIFERTFIADSYANRIGKGTHRAIDQCQEYARRYRYVLTCDVRQHFPSLDHEVLLAILAKTLRNAETLALCRIIVESGAGILDEEYRHVYFPGDDLFSRLRPRGLPIGNLTSQFWSNCYLNPFDHFVKRWLRCKGYLRYVDDFLLFADDPKQLWRWKHEVIARLADLRLTLHEPRTQVRRVEEGIPWLGFVVYPNHRRLKRRNVIKASRRLRAKTADARNGGDAAAEALAASWQGWTAHARHTHSPALIETMRERVGIPHASDGSIREQQPDAGAELSIVSQKP